MKTQVQVATEVKTEEFNAVEFIKKHGTKSAAIRQLLADGRERKVVAKMLGIRYQHVRNVAITPIKKQRVVTAEQK